MSERTGVDMEQSRNTFRPARVEEYVDWLRGYLAEGGVITHAYDYPFARAAFLLARDDFTTGGECGSNAAPIVVPAGLRYRGGGLGHNSLYFMDDLTVAGDWVPIYSDAEFDALPGVREAREADAERRAASERRMRQLEAESAERALTSDLSAYKFLRR